MNESEATKKGSGRKWVVRGASVLLGLMVGLVIAEVGFSARDDSAWPHLNVYIPDDTLGVALWPGEETRVAFRGNPASEVNINSVGFRGPDLVEEPRDEILVLGDSQVFGLGVNDDETLVARLGEALGRPVINAGVPTYGPIEYVAVAEKVFEARTPSTVVVVINTANDFFEHSRPNTERHAVWDGWAVRAETAPEDVLAFPGRDFLYRRSHAFLAMRQLAHAVDESIEGVRDTGFASEGTLRDLIHEGEEVEHLHEAADRAHRAEVAAHHARLAGIEAEIDTTEEEVNSEISDELAELAANTDYGYDDDDYYEGDPERDPALQALAARGHPGDIVGQWSEGESSRSVVITARLLNKGVRLRPRVVRQAAEGPDGQPLRALLDHRTELTSALETERANPVGEAIGESILTPRIRELAAVAEAHDAELLVVALPLDVMVSEEEFAKYDHDALDVSAASTLLDDLVASTEQLGHRAIDATDALRAAQPGAFLDGDLHLTPKGHQAVAEAIALRLSEPAPLRHPLAGLPEGRTPVPTPEELLQTQEINAAGSTRAGCATDMVREWLRVSCRRAGRNRPTGVELVEGGRGEALIVENPAAATLFVPLLVGDTVAADFHFEDRTQRLSVSWPEGDENPTLAFGEAADSARSEIEQDAAAARLCACHIEVHGWTNCRSDTTIYNSGCGRSCEELYGAASGECLAAYDHDCEALLRCARGDLEVPPPCLGDEVNALGTQRCHALCGPDAACTAGTCTPWRGTSVCVTEGAHGSEEPPSDDLHANHGERPDAAIPTTEVPTVASFGGDRCHALVVGDGIEGSFVRAVATETGALAVSHDRGVKVRAFDSSGAPRGERLSLDLPRDVNRYRGETRLELHRVSGRTVLLYGLPCNSTHCLYGAVLDDDGGAVGEAIGPFQGGDGIITALADDALWIARGGHGRRTMVVERWAVDASGAIAREEHARFDRSAYPRALGVDGERFVLYTGSRIHIGEETVLRASGDLGISMRRRPTVHIDGEDVELRFAHRIQNEESRSSVEMSRTLHLVVSPPYGDTLPEPTHLEDEVGESLDLDSPLVLDLPGRRIHRELENGVVAGRPVRVPQGGGLVWAGDHALVFANQVYAVRCY